MRTLEPSEIRLRFVPLEQLLLHEEDDPYRVRRIVDSITRDGFLRNPPIVAEYQSKYIVLDGATRVTALRAMGFRDAMVQIVEYDKETVDLSVWNHIIVGLSPEHLLADLADIDEFTIEPIEDATAIQRLNARDIEACIIMRNGSQFAVLCEGDVCDKADLLCQLVSVYRGKAEVHRTAAINMPLLIGEYPNLSAVIAFPAYAPSDVVEIALNGSKIPMGVTRHLIPGRALGLNIPIGKFDDSTSLEEKNAWLDESIRQRLKVNKIRLYQEPVFVFDE
ncbi:MAG TPA: ParB N-terminal domain-containing protein [Anaerolineales bacterium]|nr:ParB N-terminal domain-containing protein [Anaerolineales bacterium]